MKRLGLGLGLGPAFPPFNPIQQTDLKAWYEGDTGVTLTSGKVSAWGDQSPLAHSLVQASGSLQPTPNANDAGYNGHTTLSFAGGQVITDNGTFAFAQPDTWYVVGEANNNSVNGEFIDSNNGDGNRHTIFRYATGVFSAYAGTGVIDTAITSATAHVLCCVFNGASTTLYVDHYSTSASSGNAGSNPMTKLQVGGISGALLIGKIAEIQGYGSAHSAGIRQNIMQYLGLKYGLAISA